MFILFLVVAVKAFTIASVSIPEFIPLNLSALVPLAMAFVLLLKFEQALQGFL